MFAGNRRILSGILACWLVQAGAVRANEELYHKVALSTVLVYKNGGPAFGSAGTGFVIDIKERLVITARHVIENVTGGIASNIEVVFAQTKDGDIIAESKYYQTNRQKLAVRCKVVYENTRRDMAILQLEKLPANIKALELAPKRVELAHQLVPNTKALAALNNPKFPPAVAEISDLQVAAHSVGLDVTVLDASDESEIDAAFSVLSRNKVAALIITTDPFLLGQREQIVELAARHKIPRRRL